MLSGCFVLHKWAKCIFVNPLKKLLHKSQFKIYDENKKRAFHGSCRFYFDGLQPGS